MKQRRLRLQTKALPLAWLIIVGVVLSWLIFRLMAAPAVNTNLLSMLPKSTIDTVASQSVAQVQKRFERQIVWLIGAPNFSSASAGAEDVYNALKRSDQFETLILKHRDDIAQRTGAFYAPLRFNLLSNNLRTLIKSQKFDEIEQSILKKYFTPQSTLNSSIISNDPLLLLPQFFEERLAKAKERPTIENGFLTIRIDDKVYIMLTGSLADTPFAVRVQKRVMPILEELRMTLPEKYPGMVFLMAGALPHAAAGVDSALEEMSTVGLGSVLGIIIMLCIIFRSPLPLCLTLVSIAIGIGGGLAVCLAIYGQVHLLTLVFGSSLVGISVDYSLHYFCGRYRYDSTWEPHGALKHIRVGITLGLITSVIGFGGLLVAPFAGMRELAIFSSAGLFFAFGCVICWHPNLSQRLKEPRFPKLLVFARTYQDFWHRNWGSSAKIFFAILLLPLFYGTLQLTAQDDIRLLNTLNPDVLAEELQTREIIGRNLSSQFFLVEGVDKDDFLAREEKLTDQLRKLESEDKLSGFIAISDFIPSARRQRENRELLHILIDDDHNTLKKISDQVGLAQNTLDAYIKSFLRSADEPSISLDDWLQNPISEPYRHLWIGASTRGVIGVVGLKGVFDLNALHRIADQDNLIHFRDPAGEISNLFADYRQQTVWLTLASYVIVMIIIMSRYGVRQGAAVLASPIIAGFACFGLLGLFGQPISLFNIMALLLILGIGVDYALFFKETGAKHPSTLLAIGLSSITTLLAFGLLAFSSTKGIHAFGLTVMMGIMIAFLLSPMADINNQKSVG